ncbi:MAG TPA: phosphate ABC transporter permease subunit PstC, partial [Deltaproteobacteria bacterium]|nr:phosphate ABC transporter permease subunit PstC [Deltaproteobacteria bacterium]
MRHFKETLYKWIFTILAFASLLFLVGIILTLFRESYPLLVRHDFFDIVFGRFWYPTYDPPEFGM